MGTCWTHQRQQTYENNTDINQSIIDEYLLGLYENELKFKRPEEEVKCITSAVKNIVEKLMVAVREIDPTYEISKEHLVGSMAEGTSIMKPKEFDFLVALKHFSNNSDISITRNDIHSYLVTKNGEPLKSINFSTVLHQVLSSLHLKSENSEYGKLSIKSTTVCRHGPASVIKLLWQPLSKTSQPLDILVDITPCIELRGIDRVIKSRDVAIPDHYWALVKDDIYMLIQKPIGDMYVYRPTFTTTEVKIVRNLSERHKQCYMILKYCLNDNILEYTYNEYQSRFSSYIIKSFILRHAARCESITIDNTAISIRLYPCLIDILRDLQRNTLRVTINGIFGKLYCLFEAFDKKVLRLHIENTIQMLDQIGKQGKTPSNDLKFKKLCQRLCINSAVQKRAKELDRDNVECHLSLRCMIH